MGAGQDRQLDGTRSVLARLTGQVREGSLDDSKEDPGFAALIHAVHDIGRAVADRERSDLRDALPALAELREQLEGHYSPEVVATTPFAALSSDKATPYAAGALWAASAVILAALGAWDADEERELQRRPRQTVRQRVLAYLEEEPHARPKDVQAFLEQAGTPVDKSVVSRCLSDLLQAGLIEPLSAAPPSGDRRHRYYRLRAEDQDRMLAAKASRAARDLLAWCDAETAKSVLCTAVDREARDHEALPDQQRSPWAESIPREPLGALRAHQDLGR